MYEFYIVQCYFLQKHVTPTNIISVPGHPVQKETQQSVILMVIVTVADMMLLENDKHVSTPSYVFTAAVTLFVSMLFSQTASLKNYQFGTNVVLFYF